MKPRRATGARAKIAVALDVASVDDARRLAELVAPHAGVVKIGLELFVAQGPAAVRAMEDLGCDVFLDLKLHDIPETVARAVASARDLGVAFLTLHASGGRAMLEAAAKAAREELMLLGVTVLTSLKQEDLSALSVNRPVSDHARVLATLCRDAGVTGLVTSALEVRALREVLPDAFLVTPGIRPSGADAGDQARVATPADAIRAGSDLLVVGRPVRDAADPAAAVRALEAEVAAALEAGEPAP